MQLINLLKNITPVESTWTQVITGLTQDSRTVKPGNIFFALPGVQADGRRFISLAIKQGAAAILAEAANFAAFNATHPSIPIILVVNLAAKIGLIAACFYQYPSRDLQVIGITGTNGKTSCSHFIASALQMSDEICGVIGTLGYGLYGKLQHESLTTPDAITLQRVLAEMRQQQAKYIAMEVSSHGLSQGRVNGIEFAIGVFTNLTREHLDYHQDMANYAQAKRLLFAMSGLRYAVLNVDDAYGQRWQQELAHQLEVFTFALSPIKNAVGQLPHVYAHHFQLDKNGITASIHTPWGEGVLHNPHMVGRFQLSNLLAALTVLGILGVPLVQALARLAQVRGVPGRMESFGGGNKPLVVVDYSHTPDSLEQALRALREHGGGRLWCVFGCGGDRDNGKRPVMGKIAEQYADQLVITDDNPRHEEPRQIVAQILQGLSNPANAVVEHDRRRAIAHAISCAQAGDTVLVAGKGHEAYQIVGAEKLPFSDSVEVQMLLAELK